MIEKKEDLVLGLRYVHRILSLCHERMNGSKVWLDARCSALIVLKQACTAIQSTVHSITYQGMIAAAHVSLFTLILS